MSTLYVYDNENDIRVEGSKYYYSLNSGQVLSKGCTPLNDSKVLNDIALNERDNYSDYL
mgnify:CR=1 FL=1